MTQSRWPLLSPCIDRLETNRIRMTQKPTVDFKNWEQRERSQALICFLHADRVFRYEVLSDPDTREAYDRYGLEGMTGGPSASGFDPSDIMSEFFGGGGGGGGGIHFSFSKPRKSQSSTIPYDVTLEDLYNGKHVKMNLEKEVVCNTCHGYVIIQSQQTMLIFSLS